LITVFFFSKVDGLRSSRRYTSDIFNDETKSMYEKYVKSY